MGYEDIIYERKDGVATITINRPEVLNAFRTKTIEEMTEAVMDAAQDRSIGVIVIKGAGGKAFCVGGDIKEMRELTKETGRIFLNRFLNLLLNIRKAPKPVIAGVDGYCLGGGNEINITCDLTVATRKSVFGQVGPVVGSVPVVTGTQLLPRIIGEKKAREMVFLCLRYSAEEAEKLGLVNRVVDDGRLDEALDEWCRRILELSPQALRLAKLSFNFESDLLYPSLQHGIELLASLYETEEYKEGMTAFLEKRKANFDRFRR